MLRQAGRAQSNFDHKSPQKQTSTNGVAAPWSSSLPWDAYIVKRVPEGDRKGPQHESSIRRVSESWLNSRASQPRLSKMASPTFANERAEEPGWLGAWLGKHQACDAWLRVCLSREASRPPYLSIPHTLVSPNTEITSLGLLGSAGQPNPLALLGTSSGEPPDSSQPDEGVVRRKRRAQQDMQEDSNYPEI